MNKTEQKQQAGVLIVFGESVSPERAKKILAKFVAENRDALNHDPKIITFNPDWGSPCFYIP